ncbi:MAG: N-formylglutamate amidohydrolase [Flavobacteriaceae bacterium]
MKLIVTCEHGGNLIPKDYKRYFTNGERVLNSHRGYDLGALDVFNTLEPFADYALHSETSRLLIELNRSLHHPNLFSEFTKSLPKNDKEHIITSYYLPYRNEVENIIRDWINQNEIVLHLSIHSFTPILNDVKRLADIGLLYDSKSLLEKTFCKSYKKELKLLNPSLNIRYNYPYLGTADGFTRYLRKQFSKNYIGIEIEINQKFVLENKLDMVLKNYILIGLKNYLT